MFQLNKLSINYGFIYQDKTTYSTILFYFHYMFRCTWADFIFVLSHKTCKVNQKSISFHLSSFILSDLLFAPDRCNITYMPPKRTLEKVLRQFLLSLCCDVCRLSGHRSESSDFITFEG